MAIKLHRAQGSRKRLVGVLGAATLNAVLIIFLVHSQTFSSTTRTAQFPTVSVGEQRDVPLLIFIEGYDTSDPLAPRVKYKVQNVSNKAVQAYTILEEIGKSSGRTSGANIVNLGNEPNFLQPTQTRPESCDLSSPADPVTSLTLTVDYVEFGDGTTWGKDTRHSAEYLAGQREGRKALVKKIQEMREKEGNQVIEELLKKKDAEVVSPPPNHSSEWEYGFRVGHNAALYRLRTAHLKGGVQALSSELQKELENVEGRK